MRCPRCSNALREGELACTRCGQLVVKDRVTTNQLSEETTAELMPVSIIGNRTRTTTGGIVMRIRGVEKILMPHQLQNAIMGRVESSVARELPHFDLSSFGADSRGVSRRHIKLNFEDGQLTVTDLGSSNGTWLNGERLTPHQPYVVRDGSELTLGQLSIAIIFLR